MESNPVTALTAISAIMYFPTIPLAISGIRKMIYTFWVWNQDHQQRPRAIGHRLIAILNRRRVSRTSALGKDPLRARASGSPWKRRFKSSTGLLSQRLVAMRSSDRLSKLFIGLAFRSNSTNLGLRFHWLWSLVLLGWWNRVHGTWFWNR